MAKVSPLVGEMSEGQRGLCPFRKAKGARTSEASPRGMPAEAGKPNPPPTPFENHHTTHHPSPSRSARARAQAQDVRQQSAQGMPVLHSPPPSGGAAGCPPLAGIITTNHYRLSLAQED